MTPNTYELIAKAIRSASDAPGYAARNIKQDYTEVSFDGVTYLIR